MSVETPQLREQRVELILHQLEELPALPEVALRPLEVTGSDEAACGQLAALIGADGGLTQRMVQLARRAHGESNGSIDTLDRAAAALGCQGLRNLLVAACVVQQFADDGGKPSRGQFWKHAVAVGCCAQLLAEQTGGAVDPGEAFVCGLLHDLGKVALDTVLPKTFARVVEAADLLRGDIADLERSIIGLDHMVVGKRLAERYGLGAAVRECIWLHGQLPTALPANVRHPRLVNLVTLADLLVRQQHLGYSGNYTFGVPKDVLLDAVGLDTPAADTAVEKLVARIEPLARALGLDGATSDALYLQAIHQANQDLGRAERQLAAKSRRLNVHARYFDALSHFACELRPDAPALLVLQAIGQTAVGVLNISCAAVFSAIPGQDCAQILLVDHNGEVFESMVLNCPAVMLTAGDGEGPVVPAAELEWLLAAVSPRLAGQQRYWIGLEADHQCIGGIVWGAAAGEAQRLGPQAQDLAALAGGWALALRMAQIREEARTLSEQLAETNHRLQRAQEELQRSKTIIAVGEMAAGAAHEMNNPLAVISGRAQLLVSQLSDPKLKHAAKLIFDQSHSLSQVITELMDFAKPAPPVRAEADVTEIVQRALHEAKFAADPADRRFELTIADVPGVLVDAKQVTGALIEVIGNAIQATDAATGVIAIHGAYDAHSGNVALTVVDNGCGMDEATLGRAFDPFFSSKPAGRRRGMGLARALRWIESSGGSVRLESRVGQGTRAVILLPAQSGRGDQTQTSRQRPGQPQGDTSP